MGVVERAVGPSHTKNLAGANDPSRTSTKRYFFVVMASTILVVAFVGFAPSFYLRSAFEPDTKLSILLQIHGAVFSTWIILLLVQATLIVRGSRVLHRRLGWFAAAIAAAMVGLVAAATVEEMRRIPPSPPPPVALALNTFDMVVFAILVSIAIILRKQSEWHKRLLLSATLVLLGAPILRLLMFAAGHISHQILVADVLLVDLFFLICLAWDLYARQKIHPAYLYALALVLLDQVTTFSVMAWPPWIIFANAVQRLVS
jgi:hypothetical protein